jgi:hypothetical protein
MKHILIFILIGLVISSCKKDKVSVPIETNYYQSNGNFLVLKIDEDLECIYEYNLASTVLNNDSLPLYFETYSDGMNNYSYLKFMPNPDTLFWNNWNDYTFLTDKIDKNQLKSLSNSIPFDSSQFQLIGSQINTDYSLIWSKISKLDIVKAYRNSNSNSKIGINRIVIKEFDEELGFSIPHVKHLIYLVK